MSSRTPSRGRVRSDRTANRSTRRQGSAQGATSRVRTSTNAPTATLERPSARGLSAPTAPRPGTRKGAPPSVRGRRVPESAPAALTFSDRAHAIRQGIKRVPFVAFVLVLVAAGIGFTLFLSAQSTEDTYAIRAEQSNLEVLREQRDSLLTEIESDRSAESLARKASDQGMVTVLESPMVVRNDDGTTRVEGPEEATLGAPIQPLQQERKTSADSGRAPSEGSNRFGLPSERSESSGDTEGGLRVPHQQEEAHVPDLGAGRRVADLGAPAAGGPAPVQAPAPGPADAPAPAENAQVPPAAPAPADSPQ